MFTKAIIAIAVAGSTIRRPVVSIRNASLTSILIATACMALGACGDSDTAFGISTEVPAPASPEQLTGAELRVVSGDDQEAEVATMLPEPLVVEVVSSSGKPVPGAFVEWIFEAGHPITEEGIPLPVQRLLSTTDASGRSSTRWQIGEWAGPQYVSVRIATDDAESGTSSSVSAPSAAPSTETRLRGRGRAGMPHSISITPATASYPVGDSLQLFGAVRDKYGNVLTGRTISWSSSAPTVAVIRQDGMTRGLTAGSSTIAAAYESLRNTASITVTAPASSDTIPSLPPPPPTDPERLVEFSSDWSTATGRSSSALTDAGKWTVQTALTSSEVVAATGLDFPTRNVMRFSGDGDDGSEILAHLGLKVPQVGESKFYRWYWRYGADSWQGTHSIQDGATAGDINWSFDQRPIDASRHRAYLAFNASINNNASPNNKWGENTLSWSNSETYRWEVQIKRVGATTFEAHVRVYNSDGLLLRDDDDFDNDEGDTLATYVFNLNDVSNLDGLRFGPNGDDNVIGFTIFAYVGAVAVCSTWCGPYAGGI